MSQKDGRDQMFIDFVDVEGVWHTKLPSKNFYVNKINKHLILGNNLGTKNFGGVGQSFWDGGSIMIIQIILFCL